MKKIETNVTSLNFSVSESWYGPMESIQNIELKNPPRPLKREIESQEIKKKRLKKVI